MPKSDRNKDQMNGSLIGSLPLWDWMDIGLGGAIRQ